jgi:hypothetical protein
MKVFIEQQRFTQPWLIGLLVVLLIGIPLAILLNMNSMGDETEVRIVLGLAVIFDLLILGLILTVRLMTRIDETGIHYRFYPIHFKYRVIPWVDLHKCYTRKYQPVREYGGWGIKPSLKKGLGKSFTVKGTMGIQLELTNGKKVLIGTQLPDAVDRTLYNYKHKLATDETH